MVVRSGFVVVVCSSVSMCVLLMSHAASVLASRVFRVAVIASLVSDSDIPPFHNSHIQALVMIPAHIGVVVCAL